MTAGEIGAQILMAVAVLDHIHTVWSTRRAQPEQIPWQVYASTLTWAALALVGFVVSG